MLLQGKRIILKPAAKEDAQSLLDLEVRNRPFFQQFSGKKDGSFYTYEGQADRIGRFLEQSEADQAYLFLIFFPGSDEVIGEVMLTEVARGNLQGCWIGYFLDQAYNGQGYMTEAVRLIVRYAFEELDLHRIEAGVMPHNAASMQVLLKAGFKKEGLARKNVKINGEWRDHQTFAILKEDILPAISGEAKPATGRSFIIFGASKGLGGAFAKALPAAGDTVWIVSRNRPQSLELKDGVRRHWIEADLASPDAGSTIAEALQGAVIDVLIYNVGIWESQGFSANYDFEKDDPQHISAILQVNLTSAITCIQQLLANLKQSGRGKIVLIGSTAGLENNHISQVAFAASKFGLRGAANALREHLKPHAIGVTCINPGELATQMPYEAGVEAVWAAYRGAQIPLQDIVELVRFVIHLSNASCIKEINVPAMLDADA